MGSSRQHMKKTAGNHASRGEQWCDVALILCHALVRRNTSTTAAVRALLRAPTAATCPLTLMCLVLCRVFSCIIAVSNTLPYIFCNVCHDQNSFRVFCGALWWSAHSRVLFPRQIRKINSLPCSAARVWHTAILIFPGVDLTLGNTLVLTL
jgi:hypothetical protein